MPDKVFGTHTWLQQLRAQQASQRAPQAPKSVQALRYFTRAGLPDDFLVTRGHANASDVGSCVQHGFDIEVAQPEMYVLVAILENVSDKELLPISTVLAKEIVTDRLRPSEADGAFLPIKLDFPLGGLRRSETLVIPLQIELRDESFPRKNEFTDQMKILKALQTASQKELVGRNPDRTIVHKKSKSAFRPADLPQPVKYTYGPRLKLSAAISNGQEIKLREFDPNNTYIYFGLLGGSCPTLYVHTGTDRNPLSYGRVLVGAVGRLRSRLEEIVHEGPAETIEVAEEEAEATTLKNVRIYVTNEGDSEALVFEQIGITVLPGIPARFSSEKFRTAKRIRIQLEGFYETLNPLLLADRPASMRWRWQ